MDFSSINDNIEIQYLAMLTYILEHGVRKGNRTDTDTLVVPPIMLQHHMSNGFPLVTSKKMGIKSIAAELEFFIKGITSKQWLKDRKCTIWNEWANQQCLPPGIDGQARYDLQEKIDDLGPVYGYQWRRFNKPYENGHPVKGMFPPAKDMEEAIRIGDQLAKIVYQLKANPDDRRMRCLGWNPLQIPQQALPACHTDFELEHIEGELHLKFNMRSWDTFLGGPYNIASYGILLLLLCKETGLTPGTLTVTANDAHVYVNHIDAIKEQLSNPTYKLPTIEFPDFTSIWDWTYTDVDLVGYEHCDAIRAPVAV